MNASESLEFIKRLIQIEQDVSKGFQAASASINMQLSQLIVGQLDRLGPEPSKKIVLTHVCKQEDGDEVDSYTAVDVSHPDQLQDYRIDYEARSSRRASLRNTFSTNETYRENGKGISTDLSTSNDKLPISHRLKSKGMQAKKLKPKENKPQPVASISSDSTLSTSEISVASSSLHPRVLTYLQQIKSRAIALYKANVPTIIISRLLDLQDPWILHVWGDYSQYPTDYSKKLRRTRKECREMYARKCDVNTIGTALRITTHKVKCHLELTDIFENFIPLEHRIDAVKAVIEGENVTKTAQIFEVSEQNLKSWLNQYIETRTIKMSPEDKILGDGDYDGLMIRKALEEYLISRDLEATADKLHIVPSTYIRRWMSLLSESIKNKSAERFFASLQEAATEVEEDPNNEAENTDVLVVPISSITLSQLIEEESVFNLPSQSPQDTIAQA